MTTQSTVGAAAGAGSLLSTFLLIHPLDPPDVVGIGDIVFLTCPFAACACAGALWQRRYALAIGLFFLVQLLMVLVYWLAFLTSTRPFLPTVCLLIAGALSGIVLFAVLPGAKWWIACGAFMGCVGIAGSLLLMQALYPLLPKALTVLSPRVYAILILFGPIMRIALGTPFNCAAKNLQ